MIYNRLLLVGFLSIGFYYLCVGSVERIKKPKKRKGLNALGQTHQQLVGGMRLVSPFVIDTLFTRRRRDCVSSAFHNQLASFFTVVLVSSSSPFSFCCVSLFLSETCCLFTTTKIVVAAVPDDASDSEKAKAKKEEKTNQIKKKKKKIQAKEVRSGINNRQGKKEENI